MDVCWQVDGEQPNFRMARHPPGMTSATKQGKEREPSGRRARPERRSRLELSRMIKRIRNAERGAARLDSIRAAVKWIFFQKILGLRPC